MDRPSKSPELTPLGSSMSNWTSENALSRLYENEQLENKTTIPVNPKIIPDRPGQHSHLVIWLAILYFLLFLIACAVVISYGIAYGYLNLRNPAVSRPITDFVRSLPFTP